MTTFLKKATDGMNAAMRVLKNEVVELMTAATSANPPKRRRVVSRTGAIYYRARVPAIPGAPPRKLSGQLIQKIGINVEVVNQGTGQDIMGKAGSNQVYARRLQYEGHPYLDVAFDRCLDQMVDKVMLHLRGK